LRKFGIKSRALVEFTTTAILILLLPDAFQTSPGINIFEQELPLLRMEECVGHVLDECTTLNLCTMCFSACKMNPWMKLYMYAYISGNLPPSPLTCESHRNFTVMYLDPWKTPQGH
jgi:hypothetical protein